VRFYEWAGQAADVELKPSGAQQASETDLMERQGATVKLTNGKLTEQTKPYEIKTLRVQFASPRPPSNDEQSLH
ncbi:MAG: hypothetical protein JO159_03880, partial [Acidobacteria bacterium]|nr:hypothetical protein [Acidobacteriota bacterium]